MNLASSYASSKSFIKFDELGLRDSRVPEQVETLHTGLKMILDETFVNNVWSSEKQRESLQDLLVEYFNSGKIHAQRGNNTELREDGVVAHSRFSLIQLDILQRGPHAKQQENCSSDEYPMADVNE